MTIFDKEALKRHFSCSFRRLKRVFPLDRGNWAGIKEPDETRGNNA
jgi:hypothetical protein